MTLKNWHRITVALAGMAFFTFLFCLPGSDLPQVGLFAQIPFFDKWVHTGIFCSIIIMWSWAKHLFSYKELLILVIMAAIYGFLIEVVQYQFIPGRSFDITDLLADIAGSFIGLLLWKVYIKK